MRKPRRISSAACLNFAAAARSRNTWKMFLPSDSRVNRWVAPIFHSNGWSSSVHKIRERILERCRARETLRKGADLRRSTAGLLREFSAAGIQRASLALSWIANDSDLDANACRADGRVRTSLLTSQRNCFVQNTF